MSVLVHVGAGERPVEWPVGLCDCCAAPGGCNRCCLVAVCPCIALGRLSADRRAKIPRGLFPGAGDYMQTCCLSAALTSIPQVGGLIYLCLFSYPLRKAGAPAHYKWDGCKEGCTLLCCGSCALCQELNTIDRRMKDGESILPGYEAPDGMEMR